MKYHTIFMDENNKVLFITNDFNSLNGMTDALRTFIDPFNTMNDCMCLNIYEDNELIGYYQLTPEGFVPCARNEEGEEIILDYED